MASPSALTDERKTNHKDFPFYLMPWKSGSPSAKALAQRQGTYHAYLARRLSGSNKSRAEIAKRAGVEKTDLAAIENGDFRFPLGRFYEITRAYGFELPALLSGLYKSDPELRQSGTFDRDASYGITWNPHQDQPLTPLLIGGDMSSFAWGTPLRRLKSQHMSVDLLELACRCSFPAHFHSGSEVIYVINGSVEVSIGGDNPRVLNKSDAIHLASTRLHAIANKDPNLTALLLVVRSDSPARAKGRQSLKSTT
ncbi:MAG TPA: cupin domain-containing protein [Opitutus sp.]|nr:cupin domain-containing protein [Opitutus sp.]